MNTGEILDLEAGRLMDEAIVYTVMGWHIESWNHSSMGGYDLRDADGEIVGGWDAPLGFSFELEPRHRWSPSTDIAAAFEIHEPMRQDGRWVRFTQALCSVFLHDDAGKDLPYEHDESNWWLMATATAHQRSRAALLVMMLDERDAALRGDNA